MGYLVTTRVVTVNAFVRDERVPYRTLPSVANDHYLDKVRMIGLEVGDDRYADDGRFVDDVIL